MNRSVSAGVFFFAVVFSFIAVTPAFALLTGTKTIGGTTPDYTTFTLAINALTSQGVGTGGVTFLVRPGNYSEFVIVNSVFNASTTNPILFQNSGGTVTITPPVTGNTAGNNGGVKFNGCQYITFDGINVTDTSSGTAFLSYGYWITNASATQGAQYNTVKNATITLRKDFATTGIWHSITAAPTSLAGSNSFDRYLNLRISKARNGVNLNSSNTSSDIGVEVGSDSSGLNYSKRFIIGYLANDTIGGPAGANGISATNMNGLTIHDIDIRNITSIAASAFIFGISNNNPTGGTTNIYNNRIYNLTTIGTNVWGGIRGVWQSNTNAMPIHYYNNMFYNFQAIAPTAPVLANGLTVVGFYCNQSATFDNNTILLTQPTGNSLNYSSYDFNLNGPTGDTLRNNVIANITPAQVGNGCFHYGVYVSHNITSFYSNNNVFYEPNTGGCVGSYNLVNQLTLAGWQATALFPDPNSYYGDPQFINSNSPYDLHILPYQLTSLEESHAAPISSVTTDIDGDIRNVTTPDIGADEGNFLDQINLLRPVGGELFRIGTVDTIRWNYSAITGNVRININRNFPAGSWDSLTTVAVGSSPYLWTVTAPATTNARIRIFSTTVSTAFDSSDANFSIASPYMTLLHPVGGETLYIGTTDSVKWSSNTLGTVTVKYNRSYPTGAWQTLATGVPVAQGYSAYAVTPLATNNVRYMVISDQNASLTDTSHSNVAIRSKAMILSHPNGGETLLLGITDTIRWTNFGTYPTTLGISYAGVNYDSVQIMSSNLPAGTNSYIWTPAGRTSTRCRIYMVDAGGLEVWSASDFTIAQPSFTLTRPTGGEIFYRGELDTVRWTSQNVVGTVRIECNYNYPTGAWTVLDSLTPVTQGYWAWSPVSGVTTYYAHIRISCNLYPSINSSAIGNFFVFQRSLVLFRPTGGETLRVLSPDTIRYSGMNLPNGVRVELNRTYPTGAWELLADSVGTSDAVWVWNSVTAPVATNARIRVTARGFTTYSYGDTSRADFQIQPQPVMYQSLNSINFAGTRTAHTDSVYVAFASRSNLAFHYLTVNFSTTYFSPRIVNTGNLINVNDSLRLWVRFTPDSVRSFTDTLRLTFDAPYNPVAIPISALGTGTYGWLSVSTLAFPNVIEPTRRDSLTLRFAVSGNAPLQNAMWVTLPAGAPFTASPANMPTMNPGDTILVKVYFAPATSGTFNGQLGLICHVLNGDTLFVNVSGSSRYVPAAPRLSVTRSGNDMVLNWSRVDTSVSGVPLTVQNYFIYTRNDYASPWVFYSGTTGAGSTTYTQSAILLFRTTTFYKVTAYLNGSTDSSDSIIRSIPKGVSEQEVIHRLNALEH